jgi:hypothetical protein
MMGQRPWDLVFVYFYATKRFGRMGDAYSVTRRLESIEQSACDFQTSHKRGL